MIPEAALTSFVAALFSMMNPLGGVGVFAGMTAERPRDERRRIAWTCAAAVAITLLIVAYFFLAFSYEIDKRFFCADIALNNFFFSQIDFYVDVISVR